MEFLEFDQLCIEMLEGLPNTKAKHCFRSALNHLKRAEKIKEIDLSMAAFRLITAEEEAATGLMLELKNKKYKNSEHLDFKSHLYKGAVIEVIRVITQFLEDNFQDSFYDLSMHKVDGKLNLRLTAEMIINGDRVVILPEPPLSIALRLGDEKYRFSMNKQLKKLIENGGSQTIMSHLREKANLRNLLLYASEKGFPSDPVITEKFFPAYKQRVLTIMRVFLMVQPYDEAQPAVQDALDIMLSILDKVRYEDLLDD